MRSTRIPLFIFFLFNSQLIAQLQTNIWYFGNQAGITFSTVPPSALIDGQMNTDEGVSTISDASGNLLFYTNGVTVWNKNHVPMSNGNGTLLGNKSTTQTLIVPKPGSNVIYYIFTADFQGAFSGGDGYLRYSEVDMNLAAGLGNVTANKNIALWTPSTEKITAVLHCNRKDIWVISHDYNSDQFRTFLVTSAGVNTVSPMLTNTGSSHAGVGVNCIGYMKVSPYGNKLACAVRGHVSSLGFVELFDFNNATGVVSNPVTLVANTANDYGIEFSPDGTKLYVSRISGIAGYPLQLYQYNLCAGSNAAIISSQTIIDAGNSTSAMQLGRDNKIYVSRFNKDSLGVINNPNASGLACNYVKNGIFLAGKNCIHGLPGFVQSYFKPVPSPFVVNVNCLTGDFTPPTVNVSNCSGSASSVTSVSWNFGDPASGANNSSVTNTSTHIFTSSGTYNVQLTLNYACGADTLKQSLIVVNCIFTATLTSTNSYCNGGNGTATVTVLSGLSPYAYFWSPGAKTTSTVTGLFAGTYTVVVTDASLATITKIVNIVANPDPIANAGNNVSINSAQSTTLSATGGSSYIWTPVTGLSCITCANPVASPTITTTYCVEVIDAKGCRDTDCLTITVEVSCSDIYIPTVFSPNEDGQNDQECIFEADCLKSTVFAIYDRWGEKIFETNNPKVCWDGIYKNIKMIEEIFIYYLEATFFNGEGITKKGNILLIK